MSYTQLAIIAHSQKMLNCAEKAQWEELSVLEKQFQPMLESFFKSIEDDKQLTQTLSKHLLDQSNEITRLIKEAQNQVLAQQSQELRNSKAMHSYLR